MTVRHPSLVPEKMTAGFRAQDTLMSLLKMVAEILILYVQTNRVMTCGMERVADLMEPR